MRLVSLRLENFRQHKSLDIQFPSGLTGILGVNGSGKSTILEAIAWAIYGNQAGVTRGDLESLIWRLAPGKSSAVAELEFVLGERVYLVKRSQGSSKSTAELAQDGKVLANSTKAVNEKLLQILGMSHQEFFNSYFTGQRDLNFLGSIKGATEREKFIAKMLGYDRLTEAQGATGKKGSLRDDKREQEKVVDRLEGGLENQLQVLADLGNYQRQLREAEIALNLVNANLLILEQQKQEYAPQWQESQQKRDRSSQILHAQQIQQTKLEQLERQQIRLREERSQLAIKVEALSQLQSEVADYPNLQIEFSQWQNLKTQSEERDRLINQSTQLQAEIANLSQQIQNLGDSARKMQETEVAIANYRSQIEQQDREIKTQTLTWQESQANLKARIHSEKQNLKKLDSQKHTITEAGAEGICPTCERPLLSEYERVVGGFETQASHIQSHLQAWQQELKGLESAPAALSQMQAIRDQLNLGCQNEQHKQIQLSAQVAQLEIYRKSDAAKQNDLAAIATNLESIPNHFNAQTYNQIQLQLQQLQPKYEEYLRSANATQQLRQIETELTNLTEQINLPSTEISLLNQQLSQLQFSETDYQTLKSAIAEFENQILQLKQSQNQATRQVALATQATQTAQASADQLAIRQQELQSAKQQLALLQELDLSFSELRQHLTEQIRPKLADSASLFLNQLTEGRYNALEIDSKYNVVVLDDGDRKPVISGGEEDIVNLSLRLAISQMIAERSGQPFSLLILDEVFGSLDEGRRDQVIALLHGLEQQFEQVLLITHIESIKDSLNHTIHLEFEPEAGYSQIVSP